MKKTEILLFIFLFFQLICAQEMEPILLLGVDVEGNEVTSTNVIKYTSGLMEGKEIIPGDFGKAIKKLWSTGLFSDIQILLNKETSDGIFIIIQVKENPILGEVKFVGNKKKKDSEFEEELGLTSGQRIQPFLIKESVEKIKQLYAEEGYLQTEVEGLLSEGSRKNVMDLTFHIQENKKVKIHQINFSGNKSFSERKLRRQLKETKQQRWYLFWRSSFDKSKYEEDKHNLASFYRNQGFRDFQILSDSIYYSADNRKMIIDFKIYEGPKYRLRNITWEGNVLFSEEELMARLGLEKGDLYNEEEFNKAVYDQVQGLYMDKGYIYSQINPQFTPVSISPEFNPETGEFNTETEALEDSLDVHFVVVENQQVSVRNINIAGNTKTRENVIRRELKIMPGDIFNRDLLIRSAREIMILNYFADVVPDVVPIDEDEVDLLITVEERSSDRANASIGFTAEYGLTGGAGVEFNNFLGRGQQLMLSFNQGTQYRIYAKGQAAKYRSLSLSFTDPMVNDTRNLVGASVFYSMRGRSPFYYGIGIDREIVGGAIRLGRRLKWPDNFFRGSWMLRGTKSIYRGSEEDLKLVGGINESIGLSITQYISRDSRNHPEFPSMGSVMNWNTTLSGGPLGGNENFHKHELKFDWYTPTFWKFVLYSSLQMGAIKEIPVKGVKRSFVPWDDRFIMGGSGIPYGIMLRGYVDNTVGPYDENPLGGRVMLKYTVEFRVPFSENPTIYGLLFAEMGNAWRDFSETDPFDLKRSAGFGIRLFMPMLGMLGFDLGYGFDDIPVTKESPEGWNFHILFGMPF